MMMTWQSLQTSSDAATRSCSRARGCVAPPPLTVGAAAGFAAAPPTAVAAAATGTAQPSGAHSARYRRWRQHCCAFQHGSRGNSSRDGSSRSVPGMQQCRQARRLGGPTARAASGGSGGSSSPGSGQQGETLADVMNNIWSQLLDMQNKQTGGGQRPTGAHVHVEGLSFQPPGAPTPLLSDVCMTLPPNQLGLVFGRSGAGKTTLLQLIAGLAQQSGGTISFSGAGAGAGAGGAPSPSSPSTTPAATAAGGLSAEERMAQAGLVFQFPERHFIGRTMSSELTVGWPVAPEQLVQRTALAQRTHQVLAAVGLEALPLDAPLANLSDGYKRRVALAVQLVRRPRLLLLDEPLAGLDWRTRGELISLLSSLKAECTMLVVSHDLRELAPLVDAAWEMRPGGRLERADVAALPTLG